MGSGSCLTATSGGGAVGTTGLVAIDAAGDGEGSGDAAALSAGSGLAPGCGWLTAQVFRGAGGGASEGELVLALGNGSRLGGAVEPGVDAGAGDGAAGVLESARLSPGRSSLGVGAAPGVAAGGAAGATLDVGTGGGVGAALGTGAGAAGGAAADAVGDDGGSTGAGDGDGAGVSTSVGAG
jgi:hypothetical protein